MTAQQNASSEGVATAAEDVSGVLRLCEELKNEGNDLFKAGKYANAIECYNQSVSKLNSITKAFETETTADAKQHKELLIELKLSCFKNCAAGCLKMDKWTDCVSYATKALELAPQDPKALFRRCQALEKLEMWKDAFSDVKALLRVESRDNAVQELARRVNAKVTEINDTQHTTAQLINDMLTALETDPSSDNAPKEDKINKACNNLLIVANESGGSSVLLERETLSRLVSLLDDTVHDSRKKVASHMWNVLAYLCRNEVLANNILQEVKVARIRKGLGYKDELISDSCTKFCQAFLDALLNIPADADRSKFIYKGDKEKFKFMCLDLNDLLVDSSISAVGRDNCIKLLIRNFLRRAGCGLMLLLMKNAVVSRMLKLVAGLDKSLSTTVNTPLHVSMFLHKFFEDFQSDQERNTFKEYIEAFIKPLVDEEASIDKKSMAMKCVIVLLQGPREVGTDMIGSLNAVEVMLELARSGSVERQKIALECIIQASAKASVGTTLLQGGVDVLQELFKSEDKEVRAKALVGLCKTGSAGGSDKSSKVLDNESMFGLAEECRLLMQGEDNFLIRCGVDGIAFLSLDADVKEDLVGDTEALSGLYKVAKSEDQTILHSVANILVNLTNAFDKPEKNPELERLAQFAKYHVPEAHAYDSDEFVDGRIKKLVDTGVIESLIHAHKSESDLTRESFSRVFFAIAKNVDHRGKVVQQGGVKCLLELSKSGNKIGQLFAAHALARVAISLNPEQAFPGQRIYELIRPLVKLLHADCTALQNFESLLALTNITHVSPSVVERIVKDKHTDSIEQYMYEDHDMLKRAAVECMVNIVHHNSEMRDRFANGASERVKLWTLYCGEWEDNYELASAAAGGLAILSEGSSVVCNKITNVSSWITILKELLVHESIDLARRAVCIVNNIINNGSREAVTQIAECEMLEILMALSLKQNDEDTLLRDTCKEALEKMKELKLIEPTTVQPKIE